MVFLLKSMGLWGGVANAQHVLINLVAPGPGFSTLNLGTTGTITNFVLNSSNSGNHNNAGPISLPTQGNTLNYVAASEVVSYNSVTGNLDITNGTLGAFTYIGSYDIEISVASPLSPKGYIALALSFLGLAWYGNRRREMYANSL